MNRIPGGDIKLRSLDNLRNRQINLSQINLIQSFLRCPEDLKVVKV